MADKETLRLRDNLVLEHLPLVRAIAIRIHQNLPVQVDLDDLIHAGILGLFDAIKKFKPEMQDADSPALFRNYAKYRIRGSIMDSLRKLDWASRDIRKLSKKVEAATRDLEVKLLRNPSEEEIAEQMGMPIEEFRKMMIDVRNIGPISASTRATAHEDLPAPDFPDKSEDRPDKIARERQAGSVLAEAIKTLPGRYQRALLLYYTEGFTMKEIGTKLGINESRTSQILKAAKEKLLVILHERGIHSYDDF